MAQKDLHAYGTLAIAKAAGYSDEDAVLLAWSNIETDYSLQVSAWNCLWSNLGLDFHFWPGDKKDLICRVDSELSNRITRRFDPTGVHLPQSLCALGIALHGLQDNYFHDDWIGKLRAHNILPAWVRGKFTPSFPFPYGHSPMGRIPDEAAATWYDPRTGMSIVNLGRVYKAIEATAGVLGGCDFTRVWSIFQNESDYDTRKQKLRELAGMPDLCFSDIRKEMLRKYGAIFKVAARAQSQIVRDYLK